MTPGIYYFYEYQADKKIRNVGFLKLTQTFQSCHLQISIRQIPAASQEKLPLSMFFFEKDKPRKKTVAELPTQNQCVSCRVTLSEADFPPNLTLAKLHGFLLQTADGRYFAASTGNRPFSVNLLTDWMEPAPCQEPDSESESIPAPEPETPSVLAEEKMCEPPEETAQPCEPTSRIRKLSYEDLSSLQKPFWRLANNSFLLHGYHNYHHLLLLEEDGHQWLGVPGIYSPREAHAAELFGFPQFTREYHQKLALSEDECSTDKDFGYWCRCLKYSRSYPDTGALHSCLSSHRHSLSPEAGGDTASLPRSFLLPDNCKPFYSYLK